MTFTAIAALICIVLGIITGFIDEKDELLFNSLTWFVLAIAFNTLGVTYSIGRKPQA